MDYDYLTEICQLKQWKTVPNKELTKDGFPVYGANGVIGYYSEYNHINETLLLGCRGTCGSVHISKPYSYINGNALCLDNLSKSYDINYVYYFLKSLDYSKIISGTGIPQITQIGLKSVTIPRYSFQKQVKISTELYSIDGLIEKNKLLLKEFENIVKSQFIEMFGDIINAPKCRGVKLKMLCRTISGGTPSTKYKEYYNGDIPWITTVQLGENFIDGSNPKAFITEEAIENSATHLIPEYSILFGTRVGVGKSSINTETLCTNQDIIAIVDIDKNKWNLLFIKHVLDNYLPYFESIKKGATILGITTEDLKNVNIPDVSIEQQNKFAIIVQQIDKSKYFGGVCYGIC